MEADENTGEHSQRPIRRIDDDAGPSSFSDSLDSPISTFSSFAATIKPPGNSSSSKYAAAVKFYDSTDPRNSVSSLLSEICTIERRIGTFRALTGQVQWLHGQFCKEIASTYALARQKLSPKLETVLQRLSNYSPAASSATVDPADADIMAQIRSRAAISPQQILDSIKTAVLNLALVMRQGECFVEWCRCEKLTSGLDQDLVWLQKAVVGGLSPEPAETHLHDFLLAFCAVCDAIHVDELEEEKLITTMMENYAGNSKSRTRYPKISLIRPLTSAQAFWSSTSADERFKTGEDKYLLLLQGKQLDDARNADLADIQHHIDRIEAANHSISADVTGNTTSEICSYKLTLSTILSEKLHYLLHDQQEKLEEGMHFDSIPEGIYANYADIELLEVIYPKGSERCLGDLYIGICIRKVTWRPCGNQVFALKEYWSSAVEHFKVEAPIHLRLHHPNVVQSICVVKQEGRYGLLMELMDMNLTEYLKSHPDLNLADKVFIMLQVAKGMEYIHSKRVTHRDLKPDNVLVTKLRASRPSYGCSGNTPIQIKISDFNIAKADKSIYRTKQIGTSFYRAPEVLHIEDHELTYTFAVDVYSFAFVCYMILSDGHEPANGGRRPDLSNPSLNCPPYLRYHIETWWDFEPNKRPPFTEICRVLRHMYGSLLRSCTVFSMPGSQANALVPSVFSFSNKDGLTLARNAAARAMKAMEEWRSSSQTTTITTSSCLYTSCRFSKVHEIPYELHVYSVLILTTQLWLLKPKSRGIKKILKFLFSPNPAVPGTAIAFH